MSRATTQGTSIKEMSEKEAASVGKTLGCIAVAALVEGDFMRYVSKSFSAMKESSREEALVTAFAQTVQAGVAPDEPGRHDRTEMAVHLSEMAVGILDEISERRNALSKEPSTGDLAAIDSLVTTYRVLSNAAGQLSKQALEEADKTVNEGMTHHLKAALLHSMKGVTAGDVECTDPDCPVHGKKFTH